MSHFKAKMHQIRFPASVCPLFVCLCLRWSLTLRRQQRRPIRGRKPNESVVAYTWGKIGVILPTIVNAAMLEVYYVAAELSVRNYSPSV